MSSSTILVYPFQLKMLSQSDFVCNNREKKNCRKKPISFGLEIGFPGANGFVALLKKLPGKVACRMDEINGF